MLPPKSPPQRLDLWLRWLSARRRGGEIRHNRLLLWSGFLYNAAPGGGGGFGHTVSQYARAKERKRGIYDFIWSVPLPPRHKWRTRIPGFIQIYVLALCSWFSGKCDASVFFWNSSLGSRVYYFSFIFFLRLLRWEEGGEGISQLSRVISLAAGYRRPIGAEIAVFWTTYRFNCIFLHFRENSEVF